MRIVRQAFSVAALLLASQAALAAPFTSTSYNADITFEDQLGATSMTIAFDGGNYWSASGGGTSGTRYARYDAAGAANGTFAPGIDFRSVFTDQAGQVYARGFASGTIYKQTAPGVFTTHVVLSGGSLDAQSSVVLNEDGEYVAMQGGTVSRWAANGAFLGSFALTGYSGSGGYPFDRGIAAAEDYLFTYAISGVLSAWDYAGNLVDTATLVGAGTSFDSGFSLSYANDRIFVVDSAGATWRGYNIGVASDDGRLPEPGTLGLVAVAALGLAMRRRAAA